MKGVDLNYWQEETPPLDEYEFVIVRFGGGYLMDNRAHQHGAAAVAAGKPLGCYWDIMHQDAEEPSVIYDPVRQARNFLNVAVDLPDSEMLTGVPRFWVDVEQLGVTAAILWLFLSTWEAVRPGARIGIYCSQNSWYATVGRNHPEFARFPLWLCDYQGPLNYPDIWLLPGAAPAVLHQTRGNPLDLDETMTIIYTPNHPPLGLHHAAGGTEIARTLELIPAVSKAIDTDLGALSTAHAGTLTIGRLNDMGKLSGQGFDVNRYMDQGAGAEPMADVYFQFLLPSVKANPWIACWEGPIMQVPRSDDEREANDANAKEAYDADRRNFMLWYGEFAYQLARRLGTVDKLAGVGSWASGTPRPEHNLLRYWGRALEATAEFSAVQCYQDYAMDPTLPRAHYFNAEFEKLGYHNVLQVATELGVNEWGGGWRPLFANWDVCYGMVVKPWMDAAALAQFPLYGCFYSDGGTQQWAGHDVSNTTFVPRLAEWRAPVKEDDVTTQAQIDAIKAARAGVQTKLNEMDALINALTPDVAPARHTLRNLTNQQVINLFYGVFSSYSQLADAGGVQFLHDHKAEMYAGPAVEDMASLTAGQKALVLTALAALAPAG